MRRSRRTHNPFLAKPTNYEGGTSIGVDTHPGFHTARDIETTLPYVYGKSGPASESDAADGLYGYGGVVALDMRGYTPHLDWDAEETVIPAIADILDAAPSLEDLEDLYESGDIVNEDVVRNAVQLAFFNTIGQVLEHPLDLSLFEDEDEYARFREEVNFDNPSDWAKRIIMNSVGQYRYLEDVPESRIVAAWVFQPIYPEIVDTYRDERLMGALEDAGWVFATEDELAWRETPSRSIQVYSADARPGARIEYHGSSWRNIVTAAPFLADMFDPSDFPLPLPPEY